MCAYANNHVAGPQEHTPSIWLSVDAPKTPKERVESLFSRGGSARSPYAKIKTLTKRYSLPFPLFNSNKPSPNPKAQHRNNADWYSISLRWGLSSVIPAISSFSLTVSIDGRYAKSSRILNFSLLKQSNLFTCHLYSFLLIYTISFRTPLHLLQWMYYLECNATHDLQHCGNLMLPVSCFILFS